MLDVSIQALKVARLAEERNANNHHVYGCSRQRAQIAMANVPVAMSPLKKKPASVVAKHVSLLVKPAVVEQATPDVVQPAWVTQATKQSQKDPQQK